MRASAQLARHVILAMPVELDEAQQLELLAAWVEAEYTSKGLAVEWALHRPDEGEEENPHAHLLVATRYLDEQGFGKKAREVGPQFYAGGLVGKDNPGERWRHFQEGYFRSRGLEFSVDARSAVPGLKLPKWERRVPRDVAVENELRANTAHVLVRDPALLLELVTETRAVFSERDLTRALRKHGIDGEEAEKIRAEALAQALALGDEQGPNGL